MPSTLSPRAERVVDDLVRLAGGEAEFEQALLELRGEFGPTLSAEQILDHLLRKRIEQMRAQGAAVGA